ncbi:MAG TPA: hypothetical protein VK563_12550 [Puia sp.]|nr:hypothetical protein [Puia sp.]
MQRFSFSLILVAVCLLTACKAHNKKILIYASSKIEVDNTQKNITVTEGTTHHEQELDFQGADPVTLNIQSPTGKYTLEATDDGLYIANLKNDTVVGSFQHVGEESGDSRITQDALKQKLDSLQKLVAGTNANAANKNYFIVPGKIAKITADTRARVFGPFTTIPGSFDAGSVPEIYKFYTNKEIWEIINKLTIMTIGKKV